MKEQNASGWITVRCTDELYDDAYQNDVDGDGSPSTYTHEECNYIRCIILPPEREAAVEEMAMDVLGDQYGHPVKRIMNPSFTSNVLHAFEAMEQNFKNKRLWSKKFNILFGFTLTIQQYDSWLNINRTRDRLKVDHMINDIGLMWQRVMKHSSSDLGIDDEFTRPGIEHFLLKFMDSVGSDIELNLPSSK